MSEVSVLVPSYNHAQYIERTLRSIFVQTLQPLKLLVIDDGSSDGSPEIIERVLLDCPFESELIVRENKGVCKTLNEGYSACKGKYFAYLGSDDLWLPDFLSKSIELLERRRDACLSFGNAYLIDEDDFIIDRTDNWYEFGDGEILRDLLSGNIFPSASVLYRREFLPERPWNEASRLEDYDLYLRLAAKYDLALCPELLCAWRYHGDNTSKNLPVMFPEFMKAQESAMERLDLEQEKRARMKRELWFGAAFNYIRYGYRKDAISLMIRNLRGAKSVFQVLDLLVRIMTPQALFQWNRMRKFKKARKKYGKFETS